METTIRQFYDAFKNLDSEGMTACYDDRVLFEDPAFGKLEGEHAKNMWHMLCSSQKGKDFEVVVSDIEANEEHGKAKWEAFYTFSKTGRKVHNIIHAEFKFRDGKIIEHIDRFNLYRWSKQAMGLTGFLIGWTSFFKKKLNAQVNSLLLKFEQKEG